MYLIIPLTITFRSTGLSCDPVFQWQIGIEDGKIVIYFCIIEVPEVFYVSPFTKFICIYFIKEKIKHET